MQYITGIIGHPVAHSRSPKIHNNWYQQINLNYKYKSFDVKPEDLASFFQEVKKDLQYKGFSVTVPHKETCRNFLDSESDAVKAIGACNTIVITNKKLHGENTDWQGWLTAFQNQSQMDLHKAQPEILIIGAGGAARAIAYALSTCQLQNVFITNRTAKKAEQITQEFNLNLLTNLANKKFDIIINTTSLGLNPDDPAPISEQHIHKNCIISDLTYTKNNQLSQLAKKHNITYFDGYQMLLEQAKLQHKLFIKQ